MVSLVPPGASPLSPSGASEKRSSSSAFEALMDSALFLLCVSCFSLLKNRFSFVRLVLSADELSRDDEDLRFIFVCCGLFKTLQISTWDLVVPEDYLTYFVILDYVSAILPL
ncbi:hypothetical protein NPIL_1951 [Nephila pilipes]|uniref:Uncharacterized protein n=1 Tax=Nephila pilipes TaxID=299642 RepID=A0A8X6PY97_NEPPI|nr:hypothetical protein NPIL_1951 [Nephila pilipes]